MEADEFIVPTVISFYNNDKTVRERIRTRIPVSTVKHKLLNEFQKHIKSFAGIKDHAASLGMGSFDMKLFRLVSTSSTNFLIQTQSQWDIERPSLIQSSSELNGKFDWKKIWIKQKKISTWSDIQYINMIYEGDKGVTNPRSPPP